MDPADFDSERHTAAHLEICDLTHDVLVLIFSLLHGQDIARCTSVCRYFQEAIRSDLYLQYKIELAQNGMVDGDSSTLSTSERLQRLREYSSRSRNGVFDHEDLSAHPEYSHQVRSLPQNTQLIPHRVFSKLYSDYSRFGVPLVLSVFTPGSPLAGVQSSRYLLPIGMAGGQDLVISQSAIDETQDLLVIAEIADVAVPQHLWSSMDEFHLHFHSLSGFNATAGSTRTPHPEAAVPSLDFFGIRPRAAIVQLLITGENVIWQLAIEEYRRADSISIGVCNWKTGEVVSRIDVGHQVVDVFPLEYPYLFTVPRDLEQEEENSRIPHFNVYTLSPSVTRGHHICALQLPEEHVEDDEQIEFHSQAVYTGDQPQPSEGHFHADLSRSTVVLQFFIEGIHSDREVHYLIPRTTFLAQVKEAEAQKLHQTDGGVQSVPWAAWGPQGSLRLSLYRQRAILQVRTIPFSSRFPLLVVDESDFRNAWVYVFDVNPLVARCERKLISERRRDSPGGPGSAAGIVEDIETVLPGVVDRDYSSVPYVVYRFQLPYGPEEWRFEHRIRAVVMNLTGFTVKMSEVEYDKTEQTWTI